VQQQQQPSLRQHVASLLSRLLHSHVKLEPHCSGWALLVVVVQQQQQRSRRPAANPRSPPAQCCRQQHRQAASCWRKLQQQEQAARLQQVAAAVQVPLGLAAAQAHSAVETAVLQAVPPVHLAPLVLDLLQQLAVRPCLVLQAALPAAAAAAAVLRLAAPMQQML
jgi:hypothetical protein